jgi:hypothetical protein
MPPLSTVAVTWTSTFSHDFTGFTGRSSVPSALDAGALEYCQVFPIPSTLRRTAPMTHLRMLYKCIKGRTTSMRHGCMRPESSAFAVPSLWSRTSRWQYEMDGQRLGFQRNQARRPIPIPGLPCALPLLSMAYRKSSALSGATTEWSEQSRPINDRVFGAWVIEAWRIWIRGRTCRE